MFTLTEDVAVFNVAAPGVLANDSDPDSDPLSATLYLGPQMGALTLNSDGSFSYVPARNFSGQDRFIYAARDGNGGVATATVTLQVWPVNDAPRIGLASTLYDSRLGTTPNAQGQFNFTSVPGFSTQSFVNGATLLTTTLADAAGYFHLQAPPLLDRNRGYVLRFTAQLLNENHANSDKNGDGIGDRAGFSVIILSSDLRGIELGFWANEIWAQNGGAAQPPPVTQTLFTHGEGAAFDTTAGLIPYELTILGNAYSLVVSQTEILSGSLRDYSVLGFPYNTPNFIFFGDDTTSASAIVRLSAMAVIIEATLSSRATTDMLDLPISGLGVMDIDAGGQPIIITLTASAGALSVTMGVTHGLSASDVSGNGTSAVIISSANSSLWRINHTWAASPALTYRAPLGFSGVDTVTLTVDDRGYSGGGALTATQSFTIAVTSTAAQQKMYLPLLVR